MITSVQGPAFERMYAEHAEPLLRFLIFRTGDLESEHGARSVA